MGRFRTERRVATSLKKGETIIRDNAIFTVESVWVDNDDEDSSAEVFAEGSTETTHFDFCEGETVLVLTLSPMLEAALTEFRAVAAEAGVV
jgi:hypothetical protein